MTDDLRPDDELDLIAALCDGAVTPDEVTDDALDRALQAGGTELLAAQLAERARAGHSSDGLVSGDEPNAAPIARIGPASLRRFAAAAAVLMVAGLSVVLLRPTIPPAAQPLDWARPLAGRSGFLDAPAFKSSANPLAELLLHPSSVTDAVEPRTLDSNAILYGFTQQSPGDPAADTPWSLLVVVPDSPATVADAAVARRWGLAELAAAGYRTGLASRTDGVHALVRLDASGAVRSILRDEDGDGRADSRWDAADPAAWRDAPAVFLLSEGELPASVLLSLAASHQSATADGVVPRLPAESE